MRKIISLSLAFLIVISLVLTHNIIGANEAKNKTIETKSQFVTHVKIPMPPIYAIALSLPNNIKEEENKRPQYNIPLSDDTLDYLWQRSNTSNLSYTMLLAIGKLESNFQIDSVSKTQDYGLFQLHKPTAKWIAQELGLNQYDLKDAKTNIDFAIYYLTYLRDYWQQKDVSDEQLFDLLVISFHRGIEGAKRYIKSHGYDDPYLIRVKQYKEVYEKTVSG